MGNGLEIIWLRTEVRPKVGFLANLWVPKDSIRYKKRVSEILSINNVVIPLWVWDYQVIWKNGSGKSTLLKSIAAIAKWEPHFDLYPSWHASSFTRFHVRWNVDFPQENNVYFSDEWWAVKDNNFSFNMWRGGPVTHLSVTNKPLSIEEQPTNTLMMHQWDIIYAWSTERLWSEECDETVERYKKAFFKVGW